MSRIAFFTPLLPIKSGISYHSEDILPYISKEFDVDIFVDGIQAKSNHMKHQFNIYNIIDYEKRSNNYILNIYQIGNHPVHESILATSEKYPGLVILHDFALHHLYANRYFVKKQNINEYLSLLQSQHGKAARNEAYNNYISGKEGLWETDPLKYPMNKDIVKNSIGAVVFSEFSNNQLVQYGYNTPLFRMYLYSGEEDNKINDLIVNNAKKQIGVDKKEVVVASFGFINTHKRPFQLLESFGKLDYSSVKLVFVGELQKEIKKEFYDKVKRLKISDRVIVTGYVDEKLFKTYLLACDINVSLRYPTLGETSGVLMRAFAYGKPSIVTDIGSFSELSEDMLIKVSYQKNEIEEITKALDSLINNKSYRRKLGSHAKAFADSCLTISSTCNELNKFIKEIINIQEMRNSCYYNVFIEKLTENISDLGIDLSKADKLLDNLSEIL